MHCRGLFLFPPIYSYFNIQCELVFLSWSAINWPYWQPPNHYNSKIRQSLQFYLAVLLHTQEANNLERCLGSKPCRANSVGKTWKSEIQYRSATPRLRSGNPIRIDRMSFGHNNRLAKALFLNRTPTRIIVRNMTLGFTASVRERR